MRMQSEFNWDAARRMIAEKFMRSYGWERDRAYEAALLATDELRAEYGGMRHYIPKKNGEARRHILAEFNGRNIPELSQKYGVSIRQIYRYVGRNGENARKNKLNRD